MYTDIITIDVIENDSGGHQNLLVTIPGLIGAMKFDSYYLSLAVEPTNSLDNLSIAISRLIQFWRDKISECRTNETLFLPIDFSDEYTGCLRVHNQNGLLNLSYGYSRREGFAINPLDPEDFVHSITDFQADPLNQITISQSLFIAALNAEIRKLKNTGN